MKMPCPLMNMPMCKMKAQWFQFNFLTLSGRRDDRGRSPPAAYSYAHQGGAYRLSCLFDQNQYWKEASISRLTYALLVVHKLRSWGWGGGLPNDYSITYGCSGK